MYQGIICKLQNVAKHPNADRLNTATVAGGNTVVVGLDAKNGDLGIYFDTDGQLSDEFCQANNLYPILDDKGARIGGGFFNHKRRVTSQSFRGIKSHGFWMPVNSLAFTGYDVTRLKDGDQIVELNKIPICNKYYTPQTLALRAKQENASKKSKKQKTKYLYFAKHQDTEQWRFKKNHLQKGDLLIVTEKLHGTSGRYAHTLSVRNTWLRRLLRLKPKRSYAHVMGSRNVVKSEKNPRGYYLSENFRWNVLEDNKLIKNLHKGETLFYEIVGYVCPGVPIMATQKVAKFKDISKKYGDTITYSYGIPDGNCQMYVYAITMTNEDGVVVQLSWAQVKERCHQLGIKHVPELFTYLVKDTPIPEDLIPELDQSTIAQHMAEGVCIRVECAAGPVHIYKYKTFNFGLAEGYLKEDPDYIDTEEIS